MLMIKRHECLVSVTLLCLIDQFIYEGFFLLLLFQNITAAGMTFSVLLPKTDSKYGWDAKEKIDVLKW